MPTFKKNVPSPDQLCILLLVKGLKSRQFISAASILDYYSARPLYISWTGFKPTIFRYTCMIAC